MVSSERKYVLVQTLSASLASGYRTHSAHTQNPGIKTFRRCTWDPLNALCTFSLLLVSRRSFPNAEAISTIWMVSRNCLQIYVCRFYVAHLKAFFFFTFKLAMIENIEGKQNIGLPRVRKLFLILMLLQISLRFPNVLTLPLFLRNWFLTTGHR